MPPRRPPVMRSVASIDAKPNHALKTTTLVERVPRSIDDTSLTEGTKRAIRHVDECLEVLGGYMMGGVLRMTVGETVARDAPAWDCDFVEEVLRYVIEKPMRWKPGTVMARDTFRGYTNELLAACRAVAYNPISKSERIRVYRRMEDLIKEYSLAIYGYDRAQIGYGTCNALLAAIPMSGLGWSRNMSQLLYQALAAYSGVRPDHLVRVRSISVLERPTYNSVLLGGDGARLRDFHLWYERESMTASPMIFGWFLPRGGKTQQSRGVSFPLSPTAVLGFSPAALILIYAGCRDVFGSNGISQLFSGLKGDIVFPAEHLDIPLFPSNQNPKHNVTSSSITRTIHHLCDIQGIDGLVDCRCYRSLVAAHTYAKHGAEKTVLLLGHKGTSLGVTRRYIGKAAPIDIQQAVFQDEGSKLTVLDVNRRNAKPRLNAPRTLDPQSLKSLMDEPKFQDLVRQQEQIKLDIASQKSQPDPKLIQQRRLLTSRWSNAITAAVRNALTIKKNEQLSDVATGQLRLDKAEQKDIITLERILMAEADYASRPEHTVVDASSIVMPEEEDEIELIKILFDSPDHLIEVYEKFSSAGAMAKRKIRPNGAMATRAAVAEMEADKEFENDTELISSEADE